MTQDKLKKMMDQMYQELTDPDIIEENKRKAEIKKRLIEKQEDVGPI